MSEARERALGHLRAEVAMGRGTVLLPRSLGAPSPPSSRAAPTSPPARGGTTKPATYGPLENLRDEAAVREIAQALAPVGEEAAGCTACALSKTRKTVVFARGSARSGIVLVGEAPGANEDAQGLPFVGRAGQLLDKILAAIGVDREDVYVINVLKCRPPGNRDPKPEEVATCAPFLARQLELSRPRVIAALGLHAARWLFQTTESMARLRGRVLEYRGVPALATYHPAALLRNPGLKPKTWEDFQRLREIVATSKSG